MFRCAISIYGRALRILPVFWLFLLCVLGLKWAHVIAVSGIRSSARVYVYAQLSPRGAWTGIFVVVEPCLVAEPGRAVLPGMAGIVCVFVTPGLAVFCGDGGVGGAGATAGKLLSAAWVAGVRARDVSHQHRYSDDGVRDGVCAGFAEMAGAAEEDPSECGGAGVRAVFIRGRTMDTGASSARIRSGMPLPTYSCPRLREA